MVAFPKETAILAARQFGNVGGDITGAAGTAADKITKAATTAAGGVTNAANTAGNAVGGAAQTVGDAVATGAGSIGSAADTLGALGSWMNQIKALQEAWQKYHEDIYIAAIILLALFIIMIIVTIWTCCRTCYDCCCRDERHDHHDRKGACCGLCGGPGREHLDAEKPEIVPPKREDFCGMPMDRARLARGKRAHFEGEEWNLWGRIGPNGHGSWFNVQREKDWFPHWLGGREKGQGWGEAAKDAETGAQRNADSQQVGDYLEDGESADLSRNAPSSRKAKSDEAEQANKWEPKATAKRKNPDNVAKFREVF